MTEDDTTWAEVVGARATVQGLRHDLAAARSRRAAAKETDRISDDLESAYANWVRLSHRWSGRP